MKHVYDRRMRLVLGRMQIFLSYGAVAKIDADKTSSGKASGGGRPTGDPLPLHEVWREKYDACETNPERLECCEGAEAAYEEATTRKTVVVEEESWKTMRKRLTAPKYEGEIPRDVAFWERATESLVRKARVEEFRHVESGRLIGLGEAGVRRLSVREFARLSGLSHGQAQRFKDSLGGKGA